MRDHVMPCLFESVMIRVAAAKALCMVDFAVYLC